MSFGSGSPRIKAHLTVLGGDGIGPEVIDDTRRVLGWFSANRNLAFETEEAAFRVAMEGKRVGH